MMDHPLWPRSDKRPRRDCRQGLAVPKLIRIANLHCRTKALEQRGCCCERRQPQRSASRRSGCRVQKAAHKRRLRRNYAECRIQTGLGPPCDRRGPESSEVHLLLRSMYCSKHRLRNARTCRTPARKSCGRYVAKRIIGMNCRKTVHRLNPLTKVKASSDYSDDSRLVRTGWLLLREGGDSLAHQNTPR